MVLICLHTVRLTQLVFVVFFDLLRSMAAKFVKQIDLGALREYLALCVVVVEHLLGACSLRDKPVSATLGLGCFYWVLVELNDRSHLIRNYVYILRRESILI